eukprot:s180_g11.t1
MVTKTCWEMSGAENLRFAGRLADHRTKVNAVTRGQPGQNISGFDSDMWLDLDVFFGLYNKMLPKRCTPPAVDELVALLCRDNKCRFGFKCAAGLQTAARKGLAYWPLKNRAVQGHSERGVTKASASDTFNAMMIYAVSGAVALSKVSLTGKPLADEK